MLLQKQKSNYRKYFLQYFILSTIPLIALFVLPKIIFADTHVSVQTNTGSNTVCINGKCTTSSNSTNGKANVCINGKCYSSDNGNLDVQSTDGHDQVHINGLSPTISQTPDNDQEGKDEGRLSGTPNVDAQISQAQEQISQANAKAKADEQKRAEEEKVKEQKNTIQRFFDSLKSFFQHFKLY